MKLNKVTPCGDMVLLKIVEQKKPEEFKLTNSGIIIPNQTAVGANVANIGNTGEKKIVVVYVEDMGPDVPPTVLFKKGDEVYYNNYDFVTLGDDEGTLYGLTKYSSILAVIEAER